LTHGVLVRGTIERAWHDHPHDDTPGWIEVRYVAGSAPVRSSEMVEREVYRRARAIALRQLPVRILYAAQAPREHIVVELTF
jgi:hypothetical protein